MANQPAEAYHCRAYLIKCFVHPLTASLFTTWEQVRKFDNGCTAKQALNMANQPAEAYYCRIHLINSFVHPLTAALFTTWEQVKKFNNGYTIEESLNDENILEPYLGTHIPTGATGFPNLLDPFGDEFS